MPFAPHPKRAEWEQRVQAGEDAKAVGAELGINRETLRTWIKPKPAAAPAPPADDDEPDAGGVKAPLTGREAQKPAAKGGKRSKATINEQTAEKLIEGCFMVAAVMTNEPKRLLTDVQKKALGAPFADSLAIVPAPIASAVNAYAAPGVFLTTLFGVIHSQNVAIARDRAGNPQREYTQPPPADLSAARTAAAARSGSAQQPPPTVGRPVIDMDTAAAIAAAKGGLQAEDERDDAELHYTAV